MKVDIIHSSEVTGYSRELGFICLFVSFFLFLLQHTNSWLPVIITLCTKVTNFSVTNFSVTNIVQPWTFTL